MGVVVPHRAIDFVSESTDPKQAILDFVGDLSDVQIFGNQVLIGTYFRPKRTAGGIIRVDDNLQEDMWQGKVGLVLKWGNAAYLDDDEYHFPEEDKVKVGEWCVYFVGDTKSILVRGKGGKEGGFPCRIVRDSSIRMRISDPTMIF